MTVRRVFIPIALVLILLLQLLPGGAFSAQPVAATTLCDAGQFISDVTIPDGTVKAPGEAFVKTWRIKNVGTCTWTTSYSAVFVAGTQMGATSPIALPASVAPGATIDITMNMTAPVTAGHYVGQWKLRNASGVQFGLGPGAAYTFLVDINVTATYTTAYDFVANAGSAAWASGAGNLTFPGTDGDANGFAQSITAPQLENGSNDSVPGLLMVPQKVAGGFIKATFPAYTVQTGDRFQSIVNCAYGAASCYVTFRLDYLVGGTVKTFWKFNERYEGLFYRANVNLSSLAGQNVQFILYIQDVSGRGTPAGDRALWGGPKIVHATAGPTITSGPSPTGPTPTNAAGCTNRGQFIADVTIPDGSSVAAGSTFTKTWRIKNVGTCTWTTSYGLIFVYGNAMGAPTFVPLTVNVAPGATADLSVNLVAPTTPGHYLSYWRLRNAAGVQFGVGSGMVTFFADINATANYTTAYDFAAQACSATWTSGAGTLTCPGTDGDAKGFVLQVASPKLEDGTTGAAGLLTFPQNVTDGYIQGVYPAFTVQSGDRFQSIINCQYGATGCYVTFQVAYQEGSGSVVVLKTFREKIEGLYYRLDLTLTSLAGKSVKFYLKVLATGSPAGDRAIWSGPHIARPSGSTPAATATATTAPTAEVPMITVYFHDTLAVAAPFERGVLRVASATAAGELQDVLDQMFVGPTATEQAGGLQMVYSGATGYTNFQFDSTTGIATVQLVGGCASGGAAYTIANVIMANLKQYTGVNYVKILAPDGTTTTPSGASDSIPTCLNP
jgi:hypothetical protein